MALKDLIVDSGAVTEEAIENIISDYVRYEVDPPAVVFTPEGNALDNMAKVIVYSAAIFGWKHVLKDPPVVGTKPADLEDALGIPGGTLRPVLKKLKDNHLIAVADGHYSIRASNLSAAAGVVSGEKRVAASQPKSKNKKAGDSSVAADTSAKNSAKPRKRAGLPIKDSLEALLSEGFFGEFRTLKQIVERFHEVAVIAKATSLSGPVADLVRDKIFERKKVDENGKQVWAYRALQD